MGRRSGLLLVCVLLLSGCNAGPTGSPNGGVEQSSTLVTSLPDTTAGEATIDHGITTTLLGHPSLGDGPENPMFVGGAMFVGGWNVTVAGVPEGSEALTLEKIGCLMGVTRERIRQIRERAFEKLRESPDVKGLQGFWGMA